MLDELWTVKLTQVRRNDLEVRLEARVEKVVVGDWVA